MTEPIRSFEDLKCWQACRELRRFIMREVVPVLPEQEKFRLTDQMIRAARSTTANIAEGYGRFHYLDNAKFCSNARGSCCELLDHLIAARDDGHVSDNLLKAGRERVTVALRLLNGYMSYLKRPHQDRTALHEEPDPYTCETDSTAIVNNGPPSPSNR